MMIMIILLKLLSENLQASPEKITPPPPLQIQKVQVPPFLTKFSLPPSAERGEDTVELS